MTNKLDITKHILVPKHAKLNDKEKKEMLAKYSISTQDLPKIKINDASLEDLDVSEGDVIKIVRKSATAGEALFYRRVVK